jgi:uncharacterized SAM-binding protein YcdF (DUF218 family)
LDNQFYYLSKLFWYIGSPGGLISILALLAFVAQYFKKTIFYNRIVYTLLGFIVALTFIPAGNILMHSLESSFPTNPALPKKLGGIIVLGGAVNPGMTQQWNQLETNHYNERLLYFAWLATEYPKTQLIFTGGNASMDRSKPTESDSLKSFLKLYNIEPARVILENKSRTTYENALFSSKLILKNKSKEKWLLITSAFHMPRAIGVFCQQGINAIPFPVDHQTISGDLFSEFQFDFTGNFKILSEATHEWLGLLAYFASGKTQEIFPRHCQIN